MRKSHLQTRKIASKSPKLYLILAFVLIVFVLSYFSFLKPKPRVKPQLIFEETRHVTERILPNNFSRIVHIDLKGAPPKVSYYHSLLPLLSELGATGILIEYEDMFPFETKLIKNFSALNAYTREDIRLINKIAAANNLEVIPLVQTFGHLEFLLKLEEFYGMREEPDYPQVICPLHEQTLPILTEMIEDVVKMHPRSKSIHIGADEVFYLGRCSRCVESMAKFNLTKKKLFLKHINAVAEIINTRYPDMKILMWDDAFRTFYPAELNLGQINKFVEPVVWKYTKDVYEELGPTLWNTYSHIFSDVWVASAFKGATGSNQYVSDATHYVQNHRSWLALISEYKHRIKFKGVIITGWQRYDHFSILCELLPVGLPSLAMSLRIMMGFEDSALSPPTEVAKLLGCEQPYGLIGSAFGTPKCSYLGGDILEAVLRLQQVRQEFDTMMDDSKMKGWMNEYNRKHSFSNTYHVESMIRPLHNLKMELNKIDSDISLAMSEVYDANTIEEWKETFLNSLEKEIYSLIEASYKILEKKSWPRRPLTQEREKEL